MTEGDHEPVDAPHGTETQASLEHAGGYAWRERAAAVLRNLSFHGPDLDRPLTPFTEAS